MNGARVASSLLLAVLIGGCSTASVELAPTTTEAPLDALPAGSSAYELEVTSLGGSLRRQLNQPSIVGTSGVADVRVVREEGELQAVVEILVTRSLTVTMPEQLELTLVEIDAMDEPTRAELRSAVGSTLIVERNEDWAVVGRAIELRGELDPSLSFWVERLLDAPVLFAGPTPAQPLGERARWTVNVLDPDGTQSEQQHVLTALRSDQYVISFADAPGTSVGPALSAVIEGSVGALIPTRQEIDAGETRTIVIVR